MSLVDWKAQACTCDSTDYGPDKLHRFECPAAYRVVIMPDVAKPDPEETSCI